MISFWIGYGSGKGNQKMRYGDTGLPKNCRALISSNINSVYFKVYTAEEALDSIDRNCGENGYIWNER